MTTLVGLSDGPMLCLYVIAICAGELTLLPDPYSAYKTQVYVPRLVGTVDRSPSGSITKQHSESRTFVNPIAKTQYT